MEKMVSVIVPVYNSEKYLEKCITGILEQTYGSVQLILVDNNSTDKSLSIIERYINDNRVVSIRCKQQGVSFARNAGLEVASGDYIMFVDSDDYIENDMMQYLVEGYCAEEIGLVECGFFTVKKGEKTCDYEAMEDGKRFTKKNMFEEMFCPSVGHYRGYLWNKLFQADIIKKGNVRFDTDLFYNEDRLFVCRYLACMDEASYTSYLTGRKYYYVQHEKSAMAAFMTASEKVKVTEMIAYERMSNLYLWDKELTRLAKWSLTTFVWDSLEVCKDKEVKAVLRKILWNARRYQWIPERIKSLLFMNDLLLYLFVRVKR